MTITLDHLSSGGASGVTSLTVAHNNTSTNGALVVIVDCPNGTDFLAGATVTYGGVSMGAYAVRGQLSGTSGVTYIWVMANPPAGNNNIVITPSGTAYMNVVGSTWNNVNQSTPLSTVFGQASGGTGTPYSSAVSAQPTDMVIDGFAIRNLTSTLTPLSGQTTLLATVTTDAFSQLATSYELGATTMGWNYTGGSQAISHAGVALSAAVAAAPITGSANITESSDTATISGSIAVSSIAGTIGVTEASDTAVAAGSVSSGGVITTPPLQNNTTTVLANITGITANVYNATTGALIVRKTGLVSSSLGIVTISDPSIAHGVVYSYEIDLTGSSAPTLGRILPVGTSV